MTVKLEGPRFEIAFNDERFPGALRTIARPPKILHVVGNPDALVEGLAIVGARKATPYGLSCADHFASLAASRGIGIISGGARGCDSAAHKAALKCGAPTVVFLGGGCDRIYPSENRALFQEIVNNGGAIVSENDWGMEPLRALHRLRNRLIASLAKATLIVEAGLPSGTFTTADDAIEAGREVLVVPGSITSEQSRGANRLIFQGATPIVDDQVFMDQMNILFDLDETTDVLSPKSKKRLSGGSPVGDDLLEALYAQQMTLEEMRAIVVPRVSEKQSISWLMKWLAKMEAQRLVAKYPNGKYGPLVR